MLKMTLTLCIAIYAGFVLWGQPLEQTGEPAPARPAMAMQTGPGYDRPVILSTQQAGQATVTRAAVTATVVPDAAAIAAATPAPDAAEARRIGEPTLVRLARPNADAADPVAAAAEPEGDLFRVTGSRVNMRGGPSTAYGVIDSLAEGTLAEAIGETVDGWREIRDVETGRTGFMSARFLQPA